MTEPSKPDISFARFLFLAWSYLNLPQPTRVQLDMAKFIETGPRRRMVMAFRGVAKTWITAAYAVWRLYCNPQLNVLITSASKQKADEISIFIKRIIRLIPELEHLLPRPDQRDSNIAFDVGPAEPDPSPSVKSVGITGQVTGSRADLIISDDVEVPNNSETELKREKLAELVKEFDAVLKPDGEIVYLGTPQTEDSLYNKLPGRGYTIRVWPARYPSERQREAYSGRLAPMLCDDLDRKKVTPGLPTDPTRFDDVDLQEREASYGKAGFALQFMLDTSLSDIDKHPLRLGDLVVMDLDREIAPHKVVWASGPDQVIADLSNVGLAGDRYHRPLWISKEMSPYHGVVMSIDPSGRGKDRTGYAVVGYLNGQLYLPSAGGFPEGYSEATLIKLAKVAASYKVNRIIVEENFGGGMFAELLKPILYKYHNVTVEEVRHNRQKELRICDTLEPVLAAHRLIVDSRLIRSDCGEGNPLAHQLFYQISRITRERGALAHDDALEAVAMAVAYWTEQMGVSVEDQAKQRSSEALDKELEEFHNELGIRGGITSRKTWQAADVLHRL